MNVGKAIKIARETAGLTLEQVSEKSGRTVEYLKRVEEGTDKECRFSSLDRETIASAINVPVSLLFVLGIEDTDIPESKKGMAAVLLPSMQELVKSIISEK